MSIEIHNKQINIATVILAGGKGTRLFPLTLHHSKPAVSFGGRYRLIDIPISNSLNSNIRQMFVIGQYLTGELQHHLAQTYHFDTFFPGMIDFLSPEELPTGEKVWFEGTADAIRKNLKTILQVPVDYFLILSGDQLYNIDFKQMLRFTIEKDVDLAIASILVGEGEAKRMGNLKIDDECYITDFHEKPGPDQIGKFALSQEDLYKHNIKSDKPLYLGSMGIYVFKREALRTLIEEDKRSDFGKHLIPTQLKRGKAASFIYNGYWEDIGTVDSFYNANLALTTGSIGLKVYDERNPIYSKVNHLPGAKINQTDIRDSIICDGSIIDAKEIHHSIVGLRSYIKKGTIIRDSIVMGNNFYISPAYQTYYLPERFEICENCLIEKTIIDEHVYIGNNVTLTNKKKLQNYDGENVFVRDGIIIVPSGTYIPDGFSF